MTAAHCEDTIENILAVVGDHDMTINEGNEQRIPITDFIAHPGWDPHNNDNVDDNDFAIVKLRQPIKFNDYVSPICLPSVEENYENITAKVSGWGRIYDGGPGSDVLQQVNSKQ